MCYFSPKIKNLLWFSFEKITCCAKREKKIICREENPSPPTGYQMVRPLVLTLIEDVFFACHACFHVSPLTLLLRHLFSTAQTIGCSCANIHADYYFISMIVTD